MEQLLDIQNALHLIENHYNSQEVDSDIHQRPKREVFSHRSHANSKHHQHHHHSPHDLLNRNFNSSSNDAISQVIQEIQETLETLEMKFVDHEEELSTRRSKPNSTITLSAAGFARSGKFPKVGGRVGTRCHVESVSGKVNCSDVIYDDEKTWRKSRNQIDLLIKVLKDKITHLKDIKKRMRENNKQNSNYNGHGGNGNGNGRHRDAGNDAMRRPKGRPRINNSNNNNNYATPTRHKVEKTNNLFNMSYFTGTEHHDGIAYQNVNVNKFSNETSQSEQHENDNEMQHKTVYTHQHNNASRHNNQSHLQHNTVIPSTSTDTSNIPYVSSSTEITVDYTTGK